MQMKFKKNEKEDEEILLKFIKIFLTKIVIN